MFEVINNGFGLLATVFGVVGLLGGAAGYFKASRGDSIIKYQTIEINNLRTKVTDQEKELSKCNESVMAKDATITELQNHNSYLQKLGQGSPQLKKLTTAVENQTKLISKFLERERK